MDNSNQNRFIRKIRIALDPEKKDRSSRLDLFPEQANSEDIKRLNTIKTRTKEQRLALLHRLTEQSASLNIDVMPVKDAATAGMAVSQLVQEKAPEWGENKH